ncbi:MAG: quaternary ammonium compound efflux SMR transporter SugE [Gammaproteobacteria bacterium]
MIWVIVLVAGLLEVVWAVGLKYTESFTRFWPSLLTLAAMGASLYLLSIAMRSLPVGTAYAVWVGIGAVGTAIIGVAFLGEPASAPRMLSIFAIMIGIIGLRLSA